MREGTASGALTPMPGRPSIWMGDGVALAATGVLVPGSASSSAQSPRPATLLSSSDKFQLDGARCHPWGSIFAQSAATCRGTGRSYIAVGYRVCNMSCATVWLHGVPFPFRDDSRPGRDDGARPLPPLAHLSAQPGRPLQQRGAPRPGQRGPRAAINHALGIVSQLVLFSLPSRADAPRRND